MRRPYFGWYMVGMAMLVYALVIGSTFGAFGLFVLPVSAEFNLSRADMNTAIIILNIGSALLAPFVGRALDKISAKRIMIAGAIGFGASFATLSLSRSAPLSALVIALPLAAASLAAGTLTTSVLLVRWFSVYRGRALATAAIGMSLGGVAVVPLISLLIGAFGWRTALLVTGVVVMALLLLIACWIRERPTADDQESRANPNPSAAAPSAAMQTFPPLSVLAVLSMPQFWLIGIGSALALAMPQAIMISLVPIAIELGLSMLQATSLISVAGAAAVVGKILLAVIADKIDRMFLISGFAALGAVPNVGLLLNHSYPLLLVCAALVGLLSGILAPVFYALLADRFGTTAFGTVRGLMTPLVALIGAVAIRLTGQAYDSTGSYQLVFLTSSITAIISALLLFSARFARRVEAQKASVAETANVHAQPKHA